MEDMKKNWYQLINFYRLTGITLLWTAAWIFMLPWQTDITTPFYNNIWGALFAVFGATVDKTVETQQTPDLISGIAALVLILILQLRGIFNLTDTNQLSDADTKNHRPLIVSLNLISIIVHTLFFTMLVKIFLFPDTGTASLLGKMQANVKITIFTTVCITGMLLGATSIARILVILFSLVAIFNNVSFVSRAMGVWGFLAILLATAGFYLEFCFDGFSKKNLMLDLNFLAGKYKNLELKAKEEAEYYSGVTKKVIKDVTKLL